MKLQCTIKTNDRQLVSSAVAAKRPQSSSLCIGRSSTGGDAHILLQTQSNKTGIVYKVKGNILKIFTKFIDQGKATISFQTPPHDLSVQVNDTLQLKSFLGIIRSVLQGKDLSRGGGGLSTLNPGLKMPKPPKTKLSVKSKSDYPVLEGFPRTLSFLQITGIEQSRFDERILKLLNLQCLDLTSNRLKVLPATLGSLPKLTELILKDNNLGDASNQQGAWDWMRVKPLSKNLQSLDLSHNIITALPSFLIDMTSLVKLKIDHNQLRTLPNGLGRMEALRFLSVSDNKLEFLPGSMLKMHLDEFDASGNPFKGHSVTTQPLKPQVLSLKELSAREVIRYRISVSEAVVPASVLRYLQGCDFCVCGSACFNPAISKTVSLNARKIATSLQIRAGETYDMPFRLCICSDRCVHGKFSYLYQR